MMNEFSVTDFQKLAAVVEALREEVQRLGMRVEHHTHDRLIAEDVPTPAFDSALLERQAKAAY
jgi:hypothetical protein